jgi:predicted nucleotidyltransferase
MNKLLVKQLHDIVSRYPEIEAVLLFGSRAHGDYHALSDIDLAVKAPGLSEMRWLLLAEQVENELDTLLKIDFILYDCASGSLREQIDDCHKVLYQL